MSHRRPRVLLPASHCRPHHAGHELVGDRRGRLEGQVAEVDGELFPLKPVSARQLERLPS